LEETIMPSELKDKLIELPPDCAPQSKGLAEVALSQVATAAS